MFTESKKYIGPRLPTRTIVQGHGRDKEIVVLHNEQSDEFRGMIPKSSNKSLHEYDDRRITRADLPLEFSTSILQLAMEQQGKIFKMKSCRS